MRGRSMGTASEEVGLGQTQRQRLHDGLEACAVDDQLIEELDEPHPNSVSRSVPVEIPAFATANKPIRSRAARPPMPAHFAPCRPYGDP